MFFYSVNQRQRQDAEKSRPVHARTGDVLQQGKVSLKTVPSPRQTAAPAGSGLSGRNRPAPHPQGHAGVCSGIPFSETLSEKPPAGLHTDDGSRYCSAPPGRGRKKRAFSPPPPFFCRREKYHPPKHPMKTAENVCFPALCPLDSTLSGDFNDTRLKSWRYDHKKDISCAFLL